MDSIQDKKAPTVQSQSRSCTELHKHLTSVPSCLQAKAHSPDRGLQPPAPLSPQLPAKEDEKPGKDCPSSQPAAASARDSQAPGRAGPSAQVSPEDMQAVVHLIRYMHTYCLPQRKLPPQATEPAPQPCSNPSKQVRPWARSQHPSKAVPSKQIAPKGPWVSAVPLLHNSHISLQPVTPAPLEEGNLKYK